MSYVGVCKNNSRPIRSRRHARAHTLTLTHTSTHTHTHTHTHTVKKNKTPRNGNSNFSTWDSLFIYFAFDVKRRFFTISNSMVKNKIQIPGSAIFKPLKNN